MTASVTANSRGYDGTTTATIATCSLSGVVGSDNVTCDTSTASANFADKNVGNAKTVTVTGLKLGGAAAGNYVLSATTATTAANVTAKSLTVSFTTSNKTYSSTTNASITSCTLGGVVGTEDVSCVSSTATAQFADKSVGNSKTVTGSGFTLSGAAAGNYSIGTVNTSTANITPRDLTVTATGVNKQYDGNSTATVTLSTNKLAGDAISASYANATFANKNVGTGKAVSVSGIAISGADAGNYNLTNTTASTTANITSKGVVINFTAQTRPYSGNTTATISGCSVIAVTGDDVTCDRSLATATFADKNVGVSKTVTGTAFTLAGADAANYSFTINTTTANITPRDLNVTATGGAKTYDASALTTVTLNTDKVPGDDLTTMYTIASFGDKSAGLDKLVSVSGISISGADAANYHLVNTTTTTTANISQRDLSVAASGVDKVYDTTTAATVTLSSDKLGGDYVVASYGGASFADKKVGTGKPVSVSGISIWGGDAANYHLVNTTAATTADITRKDLVVSAHGVNKIYDGNATATVTLTSDKLGADDVSAAYTSASFANKNVGAGKAVSVSGISISGTDTANYNLTNVTAATTANITPKDLTVTASGIDKIYDGNATATETLATDKLAGDYVTPTYTAALFADKNVGTGKTVSVSGISISGLDAGNYNLTNTTASTAANITQRDLHVNAAGVNKVYDGTTSATVTLSTDKLPSDNVSASYTIASFADRNVGTNKAVSVAGVAIGEIDAANYNLTSTTATTTANITSRLISIKADDKTKLLAAADPPLTYTVVLGMPAPGDSWTGALTRDSGETVGSHPIKQGTLTVNDGNSGNNYAILFAGGMLQIVYAGSGTCAGDAGHAILQPINTDGTSVFKQGSTVPAKFRVCDANGKSIGQSGVVRTFVSTDIAGTATGVNETIVSTTPDTAFRWDSTGQQWIFNISTKNLSPNHTYIYVITLDDGSTITFRFGLK